VLASAQTATCKSPTRATTASRVDPAGNISSVAGAGQSGFGGDGGPAAKAKLAAPGGVAVDSLDNLYIADTGNSRIRRVDASNGTVTTVVGNGGIGFAGDGGPAAKATLAAPRGVAVDDSGDLIIADTGNNRVRRVDAMAGVITTVAGSSSSGFSGDNDPATAVSLGGPNGVAVGNDGSLFIADRLNQRIRRVDGSGMITTVAGNGPGG
jgi:sugar lactone lactonase YvrE